MTPRFQSARRRNAEDGFVLMAVLFLAALLLITLAIAAPKMAQELRRDKERELVRRGDQYKRGIKLYYKKFGTYPASMDQLMSTNNIRYLRKKYKDPFTGKDDWKLIHFGEVHIRPLGLFGQPLGAGGAAGIPGSTPPGATPGNTSGFGNSSASGSSFGGGSTSSFGGGSTSSFGNSSFGGSGSSYGSMPTSGGMPGGGLYAASPTGSDGSSGSTTGSSGTDSSGSSFGSSSSSFGSSGSSFGSSGSSFGSSGSSFGSSNSSSFGSSGTSGTGTSGTGTSGTGSGAGSTSLFNSSSSGQNLGSGGPIVGVVIPMTKASIKEYKKQKHYNEWEFVYDPLEDQMQSAGVGGGPGIQPTSGTSGTGTGFGGTGSFGGGTSGSFGSGSSFGGNTGSGGFGSGGSGFGSGGSGFGSGSGSGSGSGFGSGFGSSGNPPSTPPPATNPQPQ